MRLANGQLSFSALTAGFDVNAGRPLVLCLHGFPDNADTYRFQMPALAAAGYRVVAPMLRGYEPSSQPADGDYSLSSLAQDVIAWLDDLGEDRVYLVGHDWGAAISYVAAALAPERFLSIATIAVPHGGSCAPGWRSSRRVCARRDCPAPSAGFPCSSSSPGTWSSSRSAASRSMR